MKPRPYRTAEEVGREMARRVANYLPEQRVRLLAAFKAELAALGIDA